MTVTDALFAGVVLITSIAVVLVIGTLARVLVGRDVGVLRMVVAGVSGTTVYVLLGHFVRPERRAAYGVAQSGVAIAVAMAVLIVLEISAPAANGSALLGIRRAARRRRARIRRYAELLSIAHRHGLLRRPRGAGVEARRRHGANLRQALSAGGVTFVKLGQLLATRPDMMTDDVATELRALQHDADPVPWHVVRPLVQPQRALGLSIEPDPVAAASVAQVHRGSRPTCGAGDPGDFADVAVKVQRPGVAEVIERDLDIVAHLAARARARRYVAGGFATEELVAAFTGALRDELDFGVEARNLTSIGEATRHRGDPIVIPRIDARLSTSTVLVMEWLDGAPVAVSRPVDRSPHQRRQLADALFTTMLHQMLDDGVFHADPHPGNVLLLADGRLGLVDFGSVGRIDRRLRVGLGLLLLALERQDPAAACDALVDIVEVRRPDLPVIERALGRLMAEHLGVGATSDAIGALYRLAADHRMRIPSSVAAAFRAIATMERTLRELDPDYDLVEAARRFARRRFGRRTDSVGGLADAHLASIGPIMGRLPRQLLRMARAAERGELRFDVRLLGEEDRHAVHHLAQCVTTTLVAVTSGLMAAVLIASEGGPRFTDAVSLHQFLGYNLGIGSVILMVRALVSATWRTPPRR